MRSIARLGLVPVALFALACADAKGADEMNADLQRDLELASGVGLELASAQGGEREVVSAIEAVPSPTVVRAPGVRPQRGGQRQPVVVPSVGSDGDDVATIDEVPATVVDSSPMPSPEPVIAARPTPVAVNFPTEGSNGGGWGDGRGGVGVVIRGGGTGVDHCERHRRGRNRPPVLINTRFPGLPGAPNTEAPFPRTGGTFPRY